MSSGPTIHYETVPLLKYLSIHIDAVYMQALLLVCHNSPQLTTQSCLRSPTIIEISLQTTLRCSLRCLLDLFSCS